MSGTPASRIQRLDDRPPRPDGEFVVYWMTSARRLRHNFALDRAIELARHYHRPLLVLEALRLGYRWGSDRLHAFVLEGMAENQRRAEGKPLLYFPYVETERDAGKGLLAALAPRAVAIVTDDFPCFMLPRMTAAAARQCEVAFEAVDSNGLLPMRQTPHAFPTAHAFRRFLQKNLLPHLADAPRANPLARLELPVLRELPRAIAERWPVASPELLAASPAVLARLPIDHSVAPVAATRGGSAAAEAACRRFLADRLDRYGDARNEPDQDAASGLSPYLHFGHVSAHQVFFELMRREGWTPDRVTDRVDGARAGFWGVGEPAEGFLDQLVTWRELGYNCCLHRAEDYDQFSSLPDWSLRTLGKHAADRRDPLYTPEQLAQAATHDPLWNAAQTELRREGRIHNYLRMLWGKKILQWTRSPEQALEVLIELNNRYALDGRNPNSYSGIFWTLGRYDRPWGPERPIFGTVRYMSSENTARKVRVRAYLERYGSPSLFD